MGLVGYGRSGLPLTTRLGLNNVDVYPNNRADLGRLPFVSCRKPPAGLIEWYLPCLLLGQYSYDLISLQHRFVQPNRSIACPVLIQMSGTLYL